MTAYDLYTDLNDRTLWQTYEHERVPGQWVRRHVHRKTGEIVDTYNVSGSVFSVTPAVLNGEGRD